MSDALYLSLWYPNLRLVELPDKLTAVLTAFAAHGGEPLVYAATVWPVSWSETPVFERVWGRLAKPANGDPGRGPDMGPNMGAEPRQAVEQALELLHDDYAYEFQIGWNLWEMESAPGFPPHEQGPVRGGPGFDPRWVRAPRLVRVTGFGPLFDDGVYEQEGHIRIDFGSDAPFLEEDADLDAAAARRVEENVRQLVDLTQDAGKNSGATARLLWSELGESLAQRLAARLGMRN